MKNVRSTSRLVRSFRVLVALVAMAGWGVVARADFFVTTNLVTDNQAANPAQITDTHLVNAWGVSFSSSSEFWVSANGTGRSVLYSVDPMTNATVKQGLEVTIPNAGSVTGQVYNGTAGMFFGSSFLFVSEDGTISGWQAGTSATVLQIASPDNVYKGAASATIGGNAYLYAANFKTGKIDVLKGVAGAPNLAGNFTDPGTPAGFAPFNIQLLGDKLYVTYAMVGAGNDEQTGAGLGFVSVFDLQGNFLARVASMGTLNAPWGLAIAPPSFGTFAGDLLVGNFGDGTINAFNLASNTFVGQLPDINGNPLAIDGLWALTTGNGTSAGSTNTIYFSAGPNDESHGLFGAISLAPEPSTLISGLIAVGVLTARWGFKRLGGAQL